MAGAIGVRALKGNRKKEARQYKSRFFLWKQLRKGRKIPCVKLRHSAMYVAENMFFD